MMKLLLCVFMLSIGVQAESVKPKSPSEIREAEEVAIKSRMAPIQKQIAEKKEEIGFANAATLNARSTSKPMNGMRRTKWIHFKSLEERKKVLDKLNGELKELQEKIAPLEAELKALKKKPLPKPDDKPKEPEKKQ